MPFVSLIDDVPALRADGNTAHDDSGAEWNLDIGYGIALLRPGSTKLDRRRTEASADRTCYWQQFSHQLENQRVVFVIQQVRGALSNDTHTLIRLGAERRRLQMDHCRHFRKFPSVFPVVDEVARRLYILETNPQYKPSLVNAHIKKRQLKITIYPLTDDKRCPVLFEQVSAPTAVFTATKGKYGIDAYWVPLGFVTRQSTNDFFIPFHHCPPAQSAESGTELISIAKVAFKADNTFSLDSCAPIELMSCSTTWTPIGGRISDCFSSNSGDTLHWAYSCEASNQMLLTAVSLRPQTFGHVKHLLATFAADTKVNFVVGVTGRFLVLLNRCNPKEGKELANTIAFSFRTRATHDLSEWADSGCHSCSTCGTRLPLTTDLMTDRLRYLSNMKAHLIELDRRVGFVCEHCGEVVAKKPKMCRVCKRIGARKYLSTDIELLSDGFGTFFCSRQCLKNNWTRHKPLHGIVAMNST